MANELPVELKTLYDALLYAYPDYGGLERLVLFGCKVTLSEVIPSTRGQKDVVFELVKTAHAQGWLLKLVAAAAADLPAIPRFAEIARAFATAVDSTDKGASTPPEGGPSDEFRAALALVRDAAAKAVPLDRALADRIQAANPKTVTDHRIRRAAEWLSARHRFDRRFVNLTVLVSPDRDATLARWRFDSLAEALADRADEKAFVVLGEPGSGKTTLLQHLEYVVAMDGLKAPAAPVPFFASLSAYKPVDGRPPNSLDWLSSEWKKRLPLLPPLAEMMVEGSVLFLLDALNEMAYRSPEEFRERADLWRDFVHNEVRPRPGVRVVFTCRSYNFSRHLAYGDRDVPQIQVERLSDDQMIEFLTAYLPDGVDAAHTFERIKSDAKQMDLFRVPFYLRMLTDQIRETGELPSDRARLFCGFVREQLRRNSADALLRPGALLDEEDFEFLYAPDVERRAPTKLPEKGLLVPSLTKLAVGMLQRDSGTERNQTRVPELEAYALMSLPAETGRDVVRAGCGIAVLDSDRVDRSVMFFHQLLQEFFAARDPSAVTAGLVQMEGFEEAVVIATGLVSDAEAHIRSVLASDPVLAARSAVSAGVDASDVLKHDICTALVARMHDSSLTPKTRAEAGVALSQIGDPRIGVGLRPDGLPDIVWCDVPAGKFIYQDGETRTLPAFRISKYPVTYRQFQAFIEASDGYSDLRWWEGLGADRLMQQVASPEQQFFAFDNHPRECVSWYDAIAFSRWLSVRLGVTITLPTEEQWEKAARGTDGRAYPYGNEFDATKGNTDRSFIGQTSAVGAFPNGASPCGALDMSGNVWEWALIDHDSSSDVNISPGGRQALRGGSWRRDTCQHAVCRIEISPDIRDDFFGFRLACVD